MKLTTLAKIGLLVFTLTFVFSSCTKEYPVEEIYIDNPLLISFKPQEIKNTNWSWNSERNRYEYEVEYPELTADMYDNGVLNASVFIQYNNFEVQTVLPYLEVWDLGEPSPVTEIFSFDVSYDTRSIVYYIQYSDLNRDDSFLPNWIEVKMSFIHEY
ncbi:hypothetical protein LJC00_03570 [Dysgonomonas sp. OttesenSCG-928-M03]|nr:hypothetical protein [Dysgonomonas sp. OttesenSCG-928-M03]